LATEAVKFATLHCYTTFYRHNRKGFPAHCRVSLVYNEQGGKSLPKRDNFKSMEHLK